MSDGSNGFVFANLSNRYLEFNFFVKSDLSLIGEFEDLVKNIDRRKGPFYTYFFTKENVDGDVNVLAFAARIAHYHNIDGHTDVYCDAIDSDERLRLLIDSIKDYCAHHNEARLFDLFCFFGRRYFGSPWLPGDHE